MQHTANCSDKCEACNLYKKEHKAEQSIIEAAVRWKKSDTIDGRMRSKSSLSRAVDRYLKIKEQMGL